MPPRYTNGHVSATAHSIHLYSTHLAVIFAIAQLSCFGDIDAAVVDMTSKNLQTKVKVIHFGTNLSTFYTLSFNSNFCCSADCWPFSHNT